MKLLLDSNIWIRYLIRDNEVSFRSCLALFEAFEKGEIRPYISTIILLEIYWVLTSYYRIQKKEVQRDIEKICALRGLVILGKTDFRRAFDIHKQVGIKLADCLIAGQIEQGIVLCTYDKEFAKIPSVRAMTPGEVLAGLKR